MQYIRIVKWEEFQHYKDRNPPWIKLHNQLLENYEFTCLPDASKAHLLCIWMLASRTNNKIPNNQQWIANKIGSTEMVDISILLKSGFIEIIDASGMLAECSEVCTVTVPLEEERRGETEQSQSRDRSASAASTDFSVFTMMTKDQVSEMRRIRRKNKGGTITDRVAKALVNEFNQALANGLTVDQCLTEWEMRSWKSFKADWMKPKINGYAEAKAAKQKEADDWANSSGTGMFDYGDVIEGEVTGRE